ncbi:MAG: rhomboid family intramembrane serine protease [Planctomycetota bacterium]|jgi:membrane associated rhomboid family serine protease
MLIPISTDTSIQRTPLVNYVLIAVNVFIFVILGARHQPTTQLGAYLYNWGTLNGYDPHLYQFLTYQFLHANFAHIFGNMLFLWVFGNPLNAKMGDVPYLFFYLACGVFAATGYGLYNDVSMVGASGAIAGITTAYLALFPRSYITVVYWFFFIGTFELPSMYMIVIKMILWDNIIAPTMVPGSLVAFDAHLAGYAFGFAAVVIMLALRLLPRDQFDIVALWRRWFQRKAMQSAMQNPEARARAQFGRVARPVMVKDVAAKEVKPTEDQITSLRIQIAQSLGRNDRDTAAGLYEEMMEIDPRQVLGRTQQLDVANQLYTLNRLPQAVAAYEKYLVHYSPSEESDHIKLLLGIIYARDLQQYEVARDHLSELVDRLSDEKRLDQCRHWLKVAEEGLGGAEF